MAKALATELYKVKGAALWEDYKKSKVDNTYIKHWIEIDTDSEAELSEIMKRLMAKETLNKGARELRRYMRTHEDVDVREYLSIYPRAFREKVMKLLSQHTGDNGFNLKENDELETRLTLMKEKYSLKSAASNASYKSGRFYKTVDN
eukprot:TRINITY_DN22729_c0_g1_i1.p1 TRINITY_DN22729_c0_g1~~TRINITY_DN22729_c0_g1_i1.p1  ORF type:complete len:147 (+),score=33.82 TRINITY_DN22729_c0_g1_i1:94-534(+)